MCSRIRNEEKYSQPEMVSGVSVPCVKSVRTLSAPAFALAWKYEIEGCSWYPRVR